MAKIDLNDGSKWLSPKEALQAARLCHGDHAGKLIIERLRADLMVAIAARSSDRKEGEQPSVFDEPAPIPASYWPQLQSEVLFWSAGDANFFFYDIYGNQTVHCSGIRFLKSQIDEAFPAPPPPSAPPSSQPNVVASPPPDDKEPEQKGPRVSEADLTRWAEAYVAVYSEKEDTGDLAWKSAKGFFQGKSVPRQAVRNAVKELRERRRGRKPAAK